MKEKWFDGNNKNDGKPRILNYAQIASSFNDFQNDWENIYDKQKRKKDNDPVYICGK